MDTTAKELWESCYWIYWIYKDKSFVNQIYFQQQLYNLKMNDQTSVHDSSNVFNSLVIELLRIGVKIDEEEQAIIFLC